MIKVTEALKAALAETPSQEVFLVSAGNVSAKVVSGSFGHLYPAVHKQVQEMVGSDNVLYLESLIRGSSENKGKYGAAVVLEAAEKARAAGAKFLVAIVLQYLSGPKRASATGIGDEVPLGSQAKLVGWYLTLGFERAGEVTFVGKEQVLALRL